MPGQDIIQVYTIIPIGAPQELVSNIAAVTNQVKAQTGKLARVSSTAVIPGVLQNSLLIICDILEPAGQHVSAFDN